MTTQTPSFFINDNLFRYLQSRIWSTMIGGPLGLHTDTVPKIWDGTYVVGAVPGVGYIISDMDNDPRQIHKQDDQLLNEFITECNIGTIIFQRVPTYLPKRERITYQCIWVKIDKDKWQYTKEIYTEGVIKTPWGADNKEILEYKLQRIK
jgi:hypothetical protein